ncbi:MAG: DMT family transporter [Candidatus Aenigmatarchaeota archaeon]
MKSYKNYLLVIIAGILFGTITVSSQLLTNLGLSLYEISIYTTIFAVLLLTPVVLIKREYLFKREDIKFFVIYGLIQAFLQIFQMGGVVLGAPIAIVTFLLYTQPIYTSIFGKFMLSEKISNRKLLAIVITIIGLFVLLKPWDVGTVGSILGIAFGLLGGIFLSLWVTYGRKSGLNKKHPITASFGMFSFSLVWLLLFAPFLFLTNNIAIIKFTTYPLEYWIYFLTISFIIFILPVNIFYKGVQKVSASTAGVLLLLEPVSATILASILFSQAITYNIILGGFLILLSNYLVIRD